MESATSTKPDGSSSSTETPRTDGSPSFDRPTSRPVAPRTDVFVRTYRSLLTHGAVRRWLLRVAACLVIAVVVGVLLSSWRVGVTAGAAALVSFIVYTSQRQSEIPQWRRPSSAPRRTEAQLRIMQRFGYRVLHARRIQDGNGQIDHFIVGRRGAFTIDSEAWDKRLPIRNKLEKLYHGPFSKNERIDEALAEARNAERLLSEELGRPIKVRAALAIYGPSMPWDSHRIRGVDIIVGTKVRKWLRSGKDRLTEEETEEIYQAAQKVLPPMY